MIINTTLFLLGFTVLIIASITDIKTREVPDWLSFSFLFTALFANLIISVIYNNFWIVLNSLAGGVFGFLLGILLFYTGQWGGGDSKILIGLFTLIGFNVQSFYGVVIGNIEVITYIMNAKWLLFMINFAIAGAFYGVLFSIYLFVAKKKQFLKSIKHIMKSQAIKRLRKFVLIFTLSIIILFGLNYFINIFETEIIILFIGLFPLIMFYLWLYAKTVDEGCMFKNISAKKITIGDWVIKDVFVNRKVKNLLKEAYVEFMIRSEKKLNLTKFEKLLTKKYIKYKYGFVKGLDIILSKKRFAKELHIVKTLMQVSSKTKFLEKAKKLKLAKEDIENFVKFLESENIYFDKHLICSFQTTGLNELQVKLIQKLYKQKKISRLSVKEGIPFIPSFLLGFIIFYVIGFWWTFLVFY